MFYVQNIDGMELDLWHVYLTISPFGHGGDVPDRKAEVFLLNIYIMYILFNMIIGFDATGSSRSSNRIWTQSPKNFSSTTVESNFCEK